MAPEWKDEVLLELEKRVDHSRRSNYVLACVAAALGYVLVALNIPLHPFLLAFIAAMEVPRGTLDPGPPRYGKAGHHREDRTPEGDLLREQA
jgi:hypothetical protein